jgi:two-component system chemotaxis response regulator CheY
MTDEVQQNQPKPAENSEGKIKILLIDDDKFLLDMYSLKFDKAGLAVDVSFSATDALKKLKEGYIPDIILLDIVMPTMNGLEFLQAVRDAKLAEKSSVIILSNNQGEDDDKKSKKLGVDGYIIKEMNIPSDVVTQVLSIYKNKKK